MENRQLVRHIRNCMFEKNIKISDLAIDIDINSSTLSRFLNFKSSISHVTLLKIFNSLDIEIANKFSNKDNTMNEEDLRLVEELSSLNPTRKKLLIDNIRRTF